MKFGPAQRSIGKLTLALVEEGVTRTQSLGDRFVDGEKLVGVVRGVVLTTRRDSQLTKILAFDFVFGTEAERVDGQTELAALHR